MNALYGNPRYLFAAVADGLVCLDDRVELKLTLGAPESLLPLLERGFDAAAFAAAAAIDERDAAAAIDALSERGMVTDRPPASPPARGRPLAEALLDPDDSDLVWTSSELLRLPPSSRRRALELFVGGLSPPGRATAYAYAAALGRGTTWGDVPDPDALDAAFELAPEGPVAVVRLADRTVTAVPPESLGRVGAAAAHRLGTVPAVDRVDAGDPVAGLRVVFRARWALRHPGDGERAAYGIASDPAGAELRARAEAVERYAAGTRERLVHATEAELRGALGADRFYRRNERQQRADERVAVYDADEPRLWAPVSDAAGEPRWVPAELVHCPFADGGRLTAIPGSSGLAAHTDRAHALDAAVRELIERDAFMWTWLQRIARERISIEGLPEDVRGLAGRVRALGYQVDLVNLTLETKPTVLAALHDEERLLVATACRDDAAAAAARALDEAALALAATHRRTLGAPAPQDVRTAVDHLLLHLARRDDNRFLVASGDLVDVREVASDPRPVCDAAAAAGDGELLWADLTSDATRPFSVVRALVPGLIPVSFGWDLEPLGMARAREPKTTADGRRLGAALDLTNTGPLLPHPLP